MDTLLLDLVLLLYGVPSHVIFELPYCGSQLDKYTLSSFANFLSLCLGLFRGWKRLYVVGQGRPFANQAPTVRRSRIRVHHLQMSAHIGKGVDSERTKMPVIIDWRMIGSDRVQVGVNAKVQRSLALSTNLQFLQSLMKDHIQAHSLRKVVLSWSC